MGTDRQLTAMIKLYEEIAHIAIRLRRPHRPIEGGRCREDCGRCEGERLYDAFMHRYSKPDDAA